MQDPRYDGLEHRVKKLEEDRDGIVESEKLLIKMARFHRVGLKVLDAKVERIELAQGDTNQRLDKIERTLESHGKRFDHIDQTLSAHTEVLNKIVSLLEKKGE